MALTLEEYLASLKNKLVAVIGIGISNTPLIKLLLKAGIPVTACDKNNRESFGPLADELEHMGAKLSLGEQYLDGLKHDVIFRTPGMRPDRPELQTAADQGSVITTEMEAFFQVCPCTIIAVTGSDGKTTTTTLISEFLKAGGYTVHVGGNIGNPLLAEVGTMRPDDFAVLELSSFQLMTLRQSPDIAVVTNLSPNHLDIHKDMAEYQAAKENIFLYQGPNGTAIFNYDNEITRAMADKAPGKTILFSRLKPLEHGVFVEDGMITIADPWGGKRTIFPTKDILLPGAHNVENYLAAIAAVSHLVPDEILHQVAQTFRGVEHRIELVRTLGDVKYYNDSIASSPTRTIAGLRSFEQKVILIAGGYDKHIPFETLGEEAVAKVKKLVLTGLTAEKIRAAVENAKGYQPGSPEIYMVPDFLQAVNTARELAEPGDIVLLSPACASFDQFKNFEERGQTFKKVVNAW